MEVTDVLDTLLSTGDEADYAVALDYCEQFGVAIDVPVGYRREFSRLGGRCSFVPSWSRYHDQSELRFASLWIGETAAARPSYTSPGATSGYLSSSVVGYALYYRVRPDTR